MKIDESVEAKVRAVLDAAVHRDASRFESTLDSLTDEATLPRAVEVIMAISAFVLFDIHNGKPSSAQTSELAADISRQEDWAEPTSEEVESLLIVLTSGDSSRLSSLGANTLIIAFLVAANLLTTASRPKEGEWWFNYLDKVEAAIETAG